MPKVAIYAGTFDPITNGHIDIISRSFSVVDHLILAVSAQPQKSTLFSLAERKSLILHDISNIKNRDRISVKAFDGLLVQFAQENNVNLLIRGLRFMSDFEYEFQMARMNNKLLSSIETIFLPASHDKHFITSHFVKEIASLGGKLYDMVSHNTAKALYKCYGIER